MISKAAKYTLWYAKKSLVLPISSFLIYHGKGGRICSLIQRVYFYIESYAYYPYNCLKQRFIC